MSQILTRDQVIEQVNTLFTDTCEQYGVEPAELLQALADVYNEQFEVQ